MIVDDGYIGGIQIIYWSVKGLVPSRDPGDIGLRLIEVYEYIIGATAVSVGGEVPDINID